MTIFIDERPHLFFSKPLCYRLSRLGDPSSLVSGVIVSSDKEREAEKSISRFLSACIKDIEPRASMPGSRVLVINTNFGCAQEAKEFLRTMYEQGFHYASPMRFPLTVNSSILGVAARALDVDSDVALLMGENAIAFGLDLLSQSDAVRECICISIDATMIGEKVNQCCVILTLAKVAQRPWRSIAYIARSFDARPGAVRRRVEAALEQVACPPVLLYASDDSELVMSSELEGLEGIVADAFCCQLETADNSGAFILNSLLETAVSLAPREPVIVAHKNQLSFTEIICLGASQISGPESGCPAPTSRG